MLPLKNQIIFISPNSNTLIDKTPPNFMFVHSLENKKMFLYFITVIYMRHKILDEKGQV